MGIYIILGTLILIFSVAPLIFIGYLIRQKSYPVKPFLLGALAFFISQVVLRIPLLTVTGFMSGSLLFLALSAGLFEETARLILGKTALKNKLSLKVAIAFGIGHAVCEILFVVVLSQVNALVLLILAERGYDLASAGLTSADLASMISSINISAAVMALIERISAMMVHISLTIVVFYGILKKESFRYLLLAIFLHGAFNFSLVSMAVYNLYVAEAVGLVLGVSLFYITVKYLRFEERALN